MGRRDRPRSRAGTCRLRAGGARRRVPVSPHRTIESSAGAGPASLSRKERVGLFLHRGLDRRLSSLGVWAYRRTRGGITRPWKVDALLLTTRGRRSGRERTVVLQFFSDGDAMIVAAANDGGASHPGWYHNLKAEPSACVEVMGRAIAVRADELPAEEAAAWWQRILHRAPSYERYARSANRRIPIVRLVPLPEAG
jgi:deazaflavin-dependent oxidoreductase (nitroreductase family)